MDVAHPLLRSGMVAFRGYQANLARIAQKHDTLVVVPTGMGKTVVALLVMADALQQGARRILLMAPTRPLVEQHGRYLREVLAEPWCDLVHVLTGTVSPTKRAEAYAAEGIVVATPQAVQNDLVGGRLDLGHVQWIIYDEAHRASGDYPYTAIGHLARQAGCRALGLTASPGHDVAKIDDVRRHLGLEHVEIRTPSDPDVAEYVQDIDARWETLPLPPTLARVSRCLQDALAARVRGLRALGHLKGRPSRPSRRDLLELQRILQKAVQGRADADPGAFQALSLQAQAMKLVHAIEQVETQGAQGFLQYMEDVRRQAADDKASKATRAVAEDPLVNEAYHVARLDATENPKMGRTAVLVQEQFDRDPDSRIIVFTHYRATCEAVAEGLLRLEGVRPVVFVGQAAKGTQKGLTQKQQAEVLERFTRGDHNVLVATSVAEEGLDIPETDLVVFYEPIPSEIRSIQRRGRTGRKRAGRVVVLMTKGTQDEAAHWIARRREQQMVRELHGLRATLSARAPAQPPGPAASPPDSRDAENPSRPDGQTTLDATPARRGDSTTSGPTPGVPPSGAGAGRGTPPPAPVRTGPRIVCDHREQAGGVVKHLHQAGAQLEMRQLEVGDFILSDRVVVERKGAADFVDSLVDGRLFDQMVRLKAYPRPLLVLEGEGLYGHRNVSPEALMGALASIMGDYSIPVYQSRDAHETARLLHAIARREQGRENRSIAIRGSEKSLDDEARQIFILSGLPGISDALAGRLLDHFGSVAAVLSAGAGELRAVEGIGAQRAQAIRRILDLPAPRRTRAETV